MASSKADRAAERRDATRIAVEMLKALGERPGDDQPEAQAKWDALYRTANPLDAKLAFYPFSDLGNVERFVERNRGRLLYVAEIGWLAWDGKRWAREGADKGAVKAAHETVRAIQTEADAIRGTDQDHEVPSKSDEPVMYSDKLSAWGRASESATRMAAIPKNAQTYLSAKASDLDSDPWCLNVLNGTLRIRREIGDGDPIEFRPHDPADMITKLAPVLYDPNAACPIYDHFLADVQPIAAMRRFLHQWGGYSLTGDTGEQKLCFFYGKGRNGKSTLVDTWAFVAGDYSETVPIESFLADGRGRNAGAATPDLVLLPGVRLLRTSEPEKGAKLAESLIKLVTGGEPIQARYLNQGYFKFRPIFKLTMSGNYRPSINGTDEGIWRRVALVPWSVTVGKPDPTLAAKMKDEASGILNRLLDGLRDYLDAGRLDIPEEVSAATADYREDSDPLGRFLAACVDAEPGGRVQSTAMHRVFTAWAKSNGEREWSPKGLASALKERGYRAEKSSVMFWVDCRLTKDEIDFAPAPPPQRGDEDE